MIKGIQNNAKNHRISSIITPLYIRRNIILKLFEDLCIRMRSKHAVTSWIYLVHYAWEPVKRICCSRKTMFNYSFLTNQILSFFIMTLLNIYLKQNVHHVPLVQFGISTNKGRLITSNNWYMSRKTIDTLLDCT